MQPPAERKWLYPPKWCTFRSLMLLYHCRQKHKVKLRFMYNLITHFWVHGNVYLQAFIYPTPPFSHLRETLESSPSLQTRVKSPSKHTHKHTCKFNQFPAHRCSVLNWHTFLSWQMISCLTSWKCSEEVGRPNLPPLIPHYPVPWCPPFKEKNKKIIIRLKNQNMHGTESSVASILTALSALSSVIYLVSLTEGWSVD